MPEMQAAMAFGYPQKRDSTFRPFSSITAKRWIKNDEDDFDIGVKNGVEHSPGELLWLCSRVVYTLNTEVILPTPH